MQAVSPPATGSTDRWTANRADQARPARGRARVLTEAPREDRRAAVCRQRHRRRLRLRVRGHEDVCGGRRGRDGGERPGEPGPRPPRGRRRPVPGHRVGLPRDGPLPAPAARQRRTWPARWSSSWRSGPRSCASTTSSSSSRCGSRPTGPTRPPWAPRGRTPWCWSCSTSSTTASSSPRSSSACGSCRWGTSRTARGCSRGRWASMLVVAGVCYLADMLVLFLAPDLGKQINAVLVIPPTDRRDVDGPVPAGQGGAVFQLDRWGSDRGHRAGHRRP